MADKKWKVAERLVARLIQDAAGKVNDQTLRNLVTSTGRIGHLTELGVDFIAGNPEDGVALIGEAKRRYLPAWLLKALEQIVARGFEYDRIPILAFQLADDAPFWIATKLGKRRMVRTWVAVPVDFFCELVQAKRGAQENDLTDGRETNLD